MAIFMSMFQYISEIIKNISPRQRVFALFLTLFFILLLTFGGNIIDTINSSNTILERKVTILETSNVSLMKQNQEMREMIIQSQLDCSKDITQLRKQMLDEIMLLEKEMKQTSNPFVLRKTSEPRVGGSGSDTVVMRSTNEQVVQVRTNTEAMTHVKKLKQKLQKEIESSDL
jgi:hypothetical protein